MSTRVPLALVLIALEQEAARTGDDRYRRISPALLRQWVHRGHLSRGPGGYDLAELARYLDTRWAPAELTVTRSHTYSLALSR